MERFGVAVHPTHIPPLAQGFLPLGLWNEAYLSGAQIPLSVAVEGPDGRVARLSTRLRSADGEADRYYLRQLVRTLLWTVGGVRVYCDHRAAAEELRRAFAPDSFERSFLESVYQKPFTVIYTENVPASHAVTQKLGGHRDGCRVGLDAGGSDRKVAAVLEGRTVYTEEVLWSPKTQSDPAYHYTGITAALRAAAVHLPRVDAVGISTAGICLDDRVRRSSLFTGVPQQLFDAAVPDIYLRAVADVFGGVPCRVVNDGDVSALSGAMQLQRGSLLGIAMGTSQAGGFVDAHGALTGWLNELAFVPVDAAPDAPIDPWSARRGCGSRYFSQDAVVRLAAHAGIETEEDAAPALRLKTVQERMALGDRRAAQVYESIGVFLGHTLALYHELYRFRCVLLQGRVVSGDGGDVICRTSRRVLREAYPALDVEILLPPETLRRVGQATAAAGLPAL